MDEYEIPKQNKSLKNITLLILACLVVAFLVVLVYYVTQINKAASSESRQETVTIARGLSTRKIADMLAGQNVINNPTVFVIYVSLHQAGSKIEAGMYLLNADMTIPEIVDTLTHGKVISSDRNLTIIEGASNKQIADYLTGQKIINQSSDFDKVLAQGNFDFSAGGGSALGGKFGDLAKQFNYQGFLFPDTYKLAPSGTADQLVAKMLANFQGKITDQMIVDIQTQHRTFSQVLILSSIIEKEVGRNKQTLTADDLAAMQNERELVASVFYNRLKAGMPLESDATVNYITGHASRSVSIADTKVKSPYNTYLNRGLPPTPISNPGFGSIKAAIYPANSNYLYFLNAPDGTAYFAKTLAEHNANKAKYLK